MVCQKCVKLVVQKPGVTPRNVGSFRGRPAAFIKHLKVGHKREATKPAAS